MNDRDDPFREETSRATSESSPYSPPPVVDEESSALPESVRRATIAPAAIAGYAFAAAVISVAALFVLGSIFGNAPTVIVMAAFFGAPMLLAALFCGRAIAVTGSLVPKAAKSVGWKALMIIVAAPASLVVFVPTCTVVSTPLVMLTITTRWEIAGMVAMFIGIFLAYLVTFYLVAAAVRSRMTSGVTQLD